jgi:alpha-D-ribose 1-methylphosphonate 5-phosphate C-P lyase
MTSDKQRSAQSLQDLAYPRKGYSFAFLDEFAKRELRRRLLKAVAIPGYQVPYGSREMPLARGWGTGGLQVTLSVVGPQDTIKVIDQGADDSVNAANIRRFIARMSGAQMTDDTLEATIIQSRHRIPEEKLAEGQVLVLQVPNPEPLRWVEPSMPRCAEMHGDADYALMYLVLYEQLVRYKQFVAGASYPVVVNHRHLMAPSPIPRWDNPKLHQAAHLTFLAAGREKRLYAVPPYTDVYPLEFNDVHFRVEDQSSWTCSMTGLQSKFMNEIPQEDGSSAYQVSDTSYAAKVISQMHREAVTIGETYYDDEGKFYHAGYLKD